MTATSFATLPMEVSDLEECWVLDQQVFEHGEAYDRDTIRELLTHRDALNVKAVTDGMRMVGFVVGMIDADETGHIVVLGVASDLRRQGVGRALMYDVEQRFLEQGVRMIHLEVRTSNVAAQALYHQLGFRIAGRRLSYYTNGDDAFLMVKLVC